MKLTFGTLPDTPVTVAVGTTDETVISITDDDPPTSLTVNFERGSYTVAEGNSVTVTVTLSDDPERTVTIPITRMDQDGASSDDYSGVPDDVVFNSGDTEKTFTFTATDDTEDDDGESVKLTFGTLPDTPVTVTVGTTGETVISITDDDRPTSLTVNFGAATYSVAESDDPSTTDVTESQVTVAVTLSDDPEQMVTIPITRMDQDGASSDDYSGVPDDVVFDSGDTEKTFTFTATDDTEDDDGESVKLTFGTLPSDPVVVTAVSPDETVISITDDDTGPSLVINPTSLPLDEVGTAMFSVQLATQPTGNVTVSVTSGDTDAATVFPASYTFSDSTWNMDQTFTVTGVNDADADNETVTISLTASGADYADVTGSVTVNVTDDDRPTSLTVEFGAATYSVAESDDPSTTDVTESQVTVAVTLSDDPRQMVTIPITRMDQDGASSDDYSGVPDDVVFSSGDTEKTFTFTATDDTEDDDGESVKLTFGTLPDTPVTVTVGTTGETVISITDDDRPTSLTVNFGAATYSVAESDDPSTTDVTESQVTVAVTLSDDPEQMVTIPITRMDQDGASSDDYSGVPDNVVFDSGDTEKTFTFTATDDTEDDDDESVKLTFGTLPSDPVVVTAVSPDETVISIADDDPPTSLTVSFERGTYTVAEGSSVMVTITLNDDPEQTVVIPLMRVTQGGASDTDYSGVPDSMTFNSGDTQQSFTFTATQDTENDDGESVEITFGMLPTNPVPVAAGTTEETVVFITDDDDPVERARGVPPPPEDDEDDVDEEPPRRRHPR